MAQQGHFPRRAARQRALKPGHGAEQQHDALSTVAVRRHHTRVDGQRPRGDGAAAIHLRAAAGRAASMTSSTGCRTSSAGHHRQRAAAGAAAAALEHAARAQHDAAAPAFHDGAGGAQAAHHHPRTATSLALRTVQVSIWKYTHPME